MNASTANLYVGIHENNQCPGAQSRTCTGKYPCGFLITYLLKTSMKQFTVLLEHILTLSDQYVTSTEFERFLNIKLLNLEKFNGQLWYCHILTLMVV